MKRLARAGSALLVSSLLVAAPAACSSTTDASDAGPRTCTRDLDCGDHHYCSEASVCRTDCYVDADCLGPTTTAQCNAQGRCVETNVDAIAPDSPGDVASEASGP